MEFFRIIKITPERIRIIPRIILKVSISPKNKTPKKSAVKGSNAPRIAVVVGPINLIAIFIVSREIIVGKSANATAHPKTFQFSIGCNFVQKFEFII